MPTTITPNLWFDGTAEQVADFHVSVFPISTLHSVTRCPEGTPGVAGTVITVD